MPFWIKPAIICYQRFGASLAYDTRNSTELPNHGQRTELDPEFSAGDTTYYKLEAQNRVVFPGLVQRPRAGSGRTRRRGRQLERRRRAVL